jgi:hypothetical protein
MFPAKRFDGRRHNSPFRRRCKLGNRQRNRIKVLAINPEEAQFRAALE